MDRPTLQLKSAIPHHYASQAAGVWIWGSISWTIFKDRLINDNRGRNVQIYPLTGFGNSQKEYEKINVRQFESVLNL